MAKTLKPRTAISLPNRIASCARGCSTSAAGSTMSAVVANSSAARSATRYNRSGGSFWMGLLSSIHAILPTRRSLGNWRNDDSHPPTTRLALRPPVGDLGQRHARRLGGGQRSRRRSDGQSAETRRHRPAGSLLGRVWPESRRLAPARPVGSRARPRRVLYQRRRGRALPRPRRRRRVPRPQGRRTWLEPGHSARLSRRGRRTRRHQPLRRYAAERHRPASLGLAVTSLHAKCHYVPLARPRRLPLARRHVQRRHSLPYRHTGWPLDRHAFHDGGERHAALYPLRQRTRCLHPHPRAYRRELAAPRLRRRLPEHHLARPHLRPPLWRDRLPRLARRGPHRAPLLAHRSPPPEIGR